MGGIIGVISARNSSERSFDTRRQGSAKAGPAIGRRARPGSKARNQLQDLVRRVRQPEAHVLHGAHKDGRIVPRRYKPPVLPVTLGIGVDRPDDHGATADDIGPGDATPQSILDQPASNAPAGVAPIDGELSDQETRDRIRGSSGPDRARRAVRLEDARRQAVVADHRSAVVDHQDAGKTASLIGSCIAGEPRIERRLAAIECVEPACVIQKFDCRKPHLAFPGRGAAQTFGGLRRGSRGGSGDGQQLPRDRLALLPKHFSRIEDDREPWRVMDPLTGAFRAGLRPSITAA